MREEERKKERESKTAKTVKKVAIRLDILGKAKRNVYVRAGRRVVIVCLRVRCLDRATRRPSPT